MAENKVLIDPAYRSNRKRIEQEEKELEELMNPKEEPEEEVVQEEVKEKEPTDPEEKTFKKRYGDLRRHADKQKKDLEDEIERLKNQSDGVKLPKSDEDIEAWANKYPDVAAIVETIATKKAQELFSKTETRFKELDEMQYETNRKSAEQVIRDSHPDFDELKASEAFHDWADEQPSWVKNALYENEDDPRSVIRVIDLYKVDMGMTTKQKKSSIKEAAKEVKSVSATRIDPEEGGRKFTESQVAKMSMKEYEKKQDEIMESIKAGSFVYDISGGAR